MHCDGGVALENASSERVVYFIEAIGFDVVKIGSTDDLASRIDSLSTAAFYELRPVRVVKGGHRRERMLHRLFAEFRIRGEWFQLSPIRTAIDALKDDAPTVSLVCACGSVKSAKSKQCRTCVYASKRKPRACVDCGTSKKGAQRNSDRCRACANKRRKPSPEAENAIINHPCAACGRERLRPKRMGKPPSHLCKPCSMRAAWQDPSYLASIMAARKSRRRPCEWCGLTEPKLREGARHHPACWEARRTGKRPESGAEHNASQGNVTL
jgi:hypothetical protein